ncbi:MAG: DUF423 domain-containing protein [Moraxella sp.]|nr:DUF423 domain-containing protein [Moraxella sp.]
MNWLKISALNLALAVALGAFGAHGLKKMADVYAQQIWQTATLYLFIHALGLLALGVLQKLGHHVAKVALCLQIGVVIFSGTLYLMALGLPRWLGAITPIGGTLMIIGWLLLAFSTLKKDNV